MVSIIIPVYNCENFLTQCIESVFNQTFKDWELILIDDCSTDGSRNIIKKYAEIDSRVKFYFFDCNVGAGLARNKGIEISEMRFIAFLDSDDFWHKDKLKMQIDFMLKNNFSFSYTRFYQLNDREEPTKIILSPKTINAKQLLRNNYIKTLTAIYDTKLLGKVYMPDYRKRQDWGLWFNILEKAKIAHCLPKPLAYYRTSNTTSLSTNKFVLIRENYNFYRLFLKKNILTCTLMMIIFLVVHLRFKAYGFKRL
ncbi:glycosyltransferase involved in cell wall biosynthesis [Mariniflexile fucanivorans]|uniref:Glycosyltransferase involved in cell wall biosynthesis n=1 Tax=Mariniflexile fucanivorans TaxID=264023 RepID=A0A4R1RT54_9FLAO|nr:glycosyltransferase family 2 protein [Mariniflexile fucanivorans]TCL69230.1 glycosyltransferase involved in cell wall biosynthesis [Mariniflexile fucanivorans]